MSIILWLLSIIVSVFGLGYLWTRTTYHSFVNQQAIKKLTQPYRRSSNQSINPSNNQTHVGLVIAHPDDEAMFFTPTLKYLLDRSIVPHVLCLTNGSNNSDNQSAKESIREKELFKSLRALGIPQSNITIIHDDRLVDSLSVTWPMKPVQMIIDQWLQESSIDRLITFDSRGVSGHPNHCSINSSVSMMLYQRTDLIAFELVTLPLATKYLALASWALSLSQISKQQINSSRPSSSYQSSNQSSQFVIISPDWSTSWRCMACHASQFVWYRRLFVFFSGYTYANVLTQIK